MTLPIIMHITYCEQGQTLDEIFKKVESWGFDGVELRRKRTGVEETDEEYLDAIADAVKGTGLKTVIFGGPGPELANADSVKREEEVEKAVKFYRLAAERFKLTVCNTFAGSLLNSDAGIPYSQYERHGSFIASNKHWEWAVEGFKAIGRCAGELGFKLAFETHMCYLHDLPLIAKRLADLIDDPSIGVNLDYGNAVYFKDAPRLDDTISMLGEKLYYIHLKNSIADGNGGRIPTGLADGAINHRQYLGLLKKAGYQGPLCLEAPRNGDREWFAAQDISYIKTLMKDIGW